MCSWESASSEYFEERWGLEALEFHQVKKSKKEVTQQTLSREQTVKAIFDVENARLRVKERIITN